MSSSDCLRNCAKVKVISGAHDMSKGNEKTRQWKTIEDCNGVTLSVASGMGLGLARVTPFTFNGRYGA